MVVAVCIAFGTKGPLFSMLRELLLPYRGLRVPGRAAVVVFLPIAVFTSIGVAWLMSRVRRNASIFVGLLIAFMIIVEYRTNVALWDVPRRPHYPPWSAPSSAVLLEYPVAAPDRLDLSVDVNYMVDRIGEWPRMINGYSGHHPSGYMELLNDLRDFPSEHALQAALQHGATHIVVHERWLEERYSYIVRALLSRSEVELVARYLEYGGEVSVFRITSARLR